MPAHVPASKFHGFHHLHFYVGNAYQAAAFYVSRFGFERFAYRGFETGNREVVTHVVKQRDIVLAFSSALTPNNREFTEHLGKHGDGVKDIAFVVDDSAAVFKAAVANGAVAVNPPQEFKDDHGSVIISSIRTVSYQIKSNQKKKKKIFSRKKNNNNNILSIIQKYIY